MQTSNQSLDMHRKIRSCKTYMVGAINHYNYSQNYQTKYTNHLQIDFAVAGEAITKLRRSKGYA